MIGECSDEVEEVSISLGECLKSSLNFLTWEHEDEEHLGCGGCEVIFAAVRCESELEDDWMGVERIGIAR